MDLLLDSQYFPSISYFAQIKKCDALVINDLENYNKQSYRNRCRILGANGVMDLIIPVDHKSGRRMNKIKLDNNDRWATIHYKSIESAYRRSPYYDYFSDEILSHLNKSTESLLELNLGILKSILKIIDLDTPVKLLSEIDLEARKDLVDLSGEIHPKKTIHIQEYHPYHQVFGTKHEADLSILDAIFCIGKETFTLL